MANVTSINPEEFLDNSQARLFQIFLVKPNRMISWTRGGGMQNVELEVQGFTNMYVFRKETVVEEYHKALRFAKAGDEYDGGKLVILELPTY